MKHLLHFSMYIVAFIVLMVAVMFSVFFRGSTTDLMIYAFLFLTLFSIIGFIISSRKDVFGKKNTVKSISTFKFFTGIMCFVSGLAIITVSTVFLFINDDNLDEIGLNGIAKFCITCSIVLLLYPYIIIRSNRKRIQ